MKSGLVSEFTKRGSLHTIDKSGRVILPSDFLDDITDTFFLGRSRLSILSSIEPLVIDGHYIGRDTKQEQELSLPHLAIYSEMPSISAFYGGLFERKLDDKNRVAIPKGIFSRESDIRNGVFFTTPDAIALMDSNLFDVYRSDISRVLRAYR